MLHLGHEVREVKDLHPTFRPQSCKRLAEIMNAGYQLSCVLKDAKGEDKDRKDGEVSPFSKEPAMPGSDPCNWKMITRDSPVENP